MFKFQSLLSSCLNPFHPTNKSSFWGPQRSLDSEPDLNLPDPFDIEEEEIILDGNSQILLEDDVNFLSQNLPARLVGSVWHLLFSTGEFPKAHSLRKKFCTMIPFSKNDS